MLRKNKRCSKEKGVIVLTDRFCWGKIRNIISKVSKGNKACMAQEDGIKGDDIGGKCKARSNNRGFK